MLLSFKDDIAKYKVETVHSNINHSSNFQEITLVLGEGGNWLGIHVIHFIMKIMYTFYSIESKNK